MPLSAFSADRYSGLQLIKPLFIRRLKDEMVITFYVNREMNTR